MYDEHSLRLLVEKRFKGTVHPDVGNFSQCPTGEAYWTICSGGIKEEGVITESFPNAAQAVNEYKKFVLSAVEAIEKYGNGKEVLYWRKLPELRREKNRFYVRSRFIISNKPQIQGSDYNKNRKEDE